MLRKLELLIRDRWAARCGALVLTLLTCCSPADHPALGEQSGSGESRYALVRDVIDGDTLVVEDAARQRETVRLIGVDTPELAHPERPQEFYALEAAAFVREACLGDKVRLVEDRMVDDRDKYGRLLRYIILEDGSLLNAELVENGYAYAYTRFSFARSESFQELESLARSQGRGLWAAGGLAEIHWIESEGRTRLGIYPTSNRSWALIAGPYVKTHIRGNQLVRQLNQLVGWMSNLEGTDLWSKLEAEDYLLLKSGE